MDSVHKANFGASSDYLAILGGFTFEFTKHAKARAQQRGVDSEALQCLLSFGHHEPDKHGCQIVIFDDMDLEESDSQFKQKLSATRNLYAVIDAAGVVITTGHRYRRVWRDSGISSLRPKRVRKV